MKDSFRPKLRRIMGVKGRITTISIGEQEILEGQEACPCFTLKYLK